MANLTAFIPDDYLRPVPAYDHLSCIDAGILSHIVLSRHWADRLVRWWPDHHLDHHTDVICTPGDLHAAFACPQSTTLKYPHGQICPAFNRTILPD